MKSTTRWENTVRHARASKNKLTKHKNMDTTRLIADLQVALADAQALVPAPSVSITSFSFDGTNVNVTYSDSSTKVFVPQS